MRISKKLTATLIALGVVGIGVMAHAAPPVGKTMLTTYSCNRVDDVYMDGPGANRRNGGYIAAHNDEIHIYEIRSDGWVYGDYPLDSGGRSGNRWFRFSDLVMNGNFQNYEANLVNVKTAPVYRTYNSGSSFGTVYNTDKVIVVDEYGSRKCIVYNLDAGGYKMGWVDKNKVTSRPQPPTPIILNYEVVPEGWYYVKSVAKPGYVIAVDGTAHGSNICVQKQNSVSGQKSNQKWYLTRSGIYYVLVNEATKLYMGYSGLGNEKNVYADSVPSNNCRFVFLKGKGKYFIEPNGNSNYLLDLYGGVNSTNNNVQIYQKHTDVNQQWELVKTTKYSTNMKGDVNNDGKITEADLNELKEYLNGVVKSEGESNFDRNNADVDGNGMITSTDASKLKGLLSSKPQPVIKQEVAKSYVDAYNDVNLTSKKTNSYIEKGETYWVIDENDKSLHVKYKSSAGADREGYVSKSIRQEVKLNSVAERMKTGVLKYHNQGQYWADGQCRGFAATVFDEIFENDTGAYIGRGWWGYYSNDNMGFGLSESQLNSHKIKTVGRVSETGLPALGGNRYPYQVNKSYTSGFYNNLRALFQKAKVGDFVQMARRHTGNSSHYCGLPHSAIIESISSNGVRFFEANVTPNRVYSKDYTWNDLANKNIGFTIYEPINYK